MFTSIIKELSGAKIGKCNEMPKLYINHFTCLLKIKGGT